MARITLRQGLRYRFDNLMARGAGPQILMLGLLAASLMCMTATVMVFAGIVPVTDGHAESFGQLIWRALMRELDAGTMGGDTGSWPFLFLMFADTLGGIFILSTLIGVLNGALGETLDEFRKGKSLVAESGHTVILGFSPKVYTLLSEIAEAKASERRGCVVILADRDKVEMDDEIRRQIGKRRLRIVTRSGNPLSLADLSIVNLPSARAVIVISPEHNAAGESISHQEADTVVLKTLVALTKSPENRAKNFHIVAELQDPRTLDVARMVTGPDAALILAPPLISRLLVQTGRQSGLSAVYTDLLDFGGSEIYLRAEEGLRGKTFRQALVAYDDSVAMGVIASDGKLFPPPMDRVFNAGDQVVAISEDDTTLILNGRGGKVSSKHIAEVSAPRHHGPERVLVLGANERLRLVLGDLDTYVAAGSEVLVVGEDEAAAAKVEALAPSMVHSKIAFRAADTTDRGVLDSLNIPSFDHVLLQSEPAGRTPDLADARTMITLLHLRDIAHKCGKTVPVTSEILDVGNRELASVAEADDFVVSNTIVSLMMAQVSENQHLVEVFDELFRPEGYEIFLKPATEYVSAGAEVDFYTVVEAAARRNEVALGYRLRENAKDSAAAYGVKLNPKKSAKLTLTDKDSVIVLAEE